MARTLRMRVFSALLLSAAASALNKTVENCPGYKATNVQTKGSKLSADLVLAGEACNVYGEDLQKLKLEVQYETKDRIHLKITDPSQDRYEVPDSIFPRPKVSGVSPSKSDIQFEYKSSPFSFSIVRTKSKEVLFTTGSHPLIFEPQYLRLVTDLPSNPNLYGLGEHTDTFRLPTVNYTRTMWSRDAYGIANGTNLYGNHPIYYEHRTSGTHGVLLLNSDGMDIKIDTPASSGSTLEYNVLGGVFDFYFFAGSTSAPTAVAKQYAELAGTPAEVPYWSFGLHQCRFGYHDYVDVAGVISNYSAAKIPLETMWVDIDYMHLRRVFTLDPDYFPVERMQEIVHYLHDNKQRFVQMVDPAVAYLPEDADSAYARGTEMDVWLKKPNGSDLLGVVWPGVTVYPDWFHPKTQEFWTGEFERFFDPKTGLDIDGVWIDMNEPASFCNYPCTDPFAQAAQQGLPPQRSTPPPAKNVPIFGRSSPSTKRAYHGPKEDLERPPYMIQDAAGDALGWKTADTDGVHANGLIEYDTHNIFGTMMSSATRIAQEARRPGKRTLIITRSTFAGAGKEVGKWLGDNLSTWWHYRVSIAGMLGMASVYQIPMVGSDICGFGDNTTETLCSRWATLGAFYPFMRNHNGDTSISQEFYRWPTVAAAARSALDTRYRLMDYFYTAFHAAHETGSTVLEPLWFSYPKDLNTFAVDMQFFFGQSILVSPITEENVTSVMAYIPKDTFYEWDTLKPVQGKGELVALEANYTSIPVHIKGGVVLPLREKGAMTTTELRKTDFELVVAPGKDGKAAGSLYVDDGESIVQPKGKTTEVDFDYANGKLSVSGSFGYNLGVEVARVKVLGIEKKPKSVKVKYGGKESTVKTSWDEKNEVLVVPVGKKFNEAFMVTVA